MINLLPPQYQNELSQEENWKLILILGFLFLIFLISLTLILSAVKIHLQGEIESLKILVAVEEKTAQTSEIQLFQTELTSFNQTISKLNSFYQSQITPTEILEKVSEVLPPSIYLTGFFWHKKISQINLSGFSPTRDILFEFKKNLEEKEEFTEIYFPPQTWIKSTDIDFNANFKIK